MNVHNFITGIERNIFSSKFDSTRLEKWKMKLTDIFQSTADHKKLMECLMKYIEYVINYGCSINNQKDQIAICRTYIGVVEVVVVSREYQNVFIQELSHKIFDIVMEEDANSWCIKKEVLKVFIRCARKVDKHIRQQTISCLPKIYLFKLFDSISTYSDYDLQVLLIETLFCMYGKDMISSKLKDLIPESENLSANFDSINLDMFYASVRKFLNVLNKTSTKIFSIKCCNIKLGNFICVQNIDELDGPWVNFNLWNNSVSWYCCNSTFDLGDEYDQDPSNYILLFGSDVKTVMVDSSSDRSGLLVTFKLKNPCICTCEKIQNYVDKCDSCYMLLNQSEESRKLVSEILPQIFRKKVVQDGIEQKKVIKNTKGNYKALKISKSKNMSNISCTTNWIYQSATTSPSSKNDILFNDVVAVTDTSLTHTESEDFLVEMSQDRYQTPPSQMADDVISLHSSLSNELLSIHDEKERFQILSGRCSKSNVNVLPVFRNQCKGVSRFSQAITNRMEDIVEENETQFQTAPETAIEEFQTAEDMTHYQVINCKASRAINEDVESFNSLKVNIFMDIKSQPISTSGNIIENVGMEGNKEEWEKDITINLQTNQASGIKVSKKGIKSMKITREKTEGLSLKKDELSKLSESLQITDKCPKLLIQDEQLPGKVSKKKKEDDNSIETVRVKNKSLEEAVALKRHGQSECFVEYQPLANSLIQKKKVSKYLISKALHTNMDVNLRLEKINEETTVSKKNCIFKQNDINKDNDLAIDSEPSEEVLVEKDQAYKLISVQKKDNLEKQVYVHSQNVDKENTDEITSKSYQKSENKSQTVQAIEKMHCYPKLKGKVKSTKKDRVGIVEDEKEKTEKMKKGRNRKPKKKVTSKIVEQINSPNWGGNDPCFKNTENDSTNNNSDKSYFHKSNNTLEPTETREGTNYSQLIEYRSDAFETTMKEQSDPIAIEGCYRGSKNVQQAELVREINSAESNGDCGGDFESVEKDRTNSLKIIKDRNDSFVSLENDKSYQITYKGENLNSNKEINVPKIVEENDSLDFVDDNVGGFGSADKDKMVDEGGFCKIVNKIQSGQSVKEIDSPKLNEERAVDFDNREKDKINDIGNKACFRKIENKIKPIETVEEIDPPKIVKSSAVGLASVEKDNSQYQSGSNKDMHSPKSIKDSSGGFDGIEKHQLFEQITNIQSSKAVEEMNPAKLITYDSCSLESAWKGPPVEAPFKTHYQKSKNILQLAEANKEVHSPKSIENRSDGFESTKKNQPDKIVDKNICRKSKKIHLVGTTEEMSSQKLIEHSGSVLRRAQKEKIDQLVNNSVHGEVKNKFQQEETEQIPVEDQESKKIQLNEIVTEIDSPKISENNSRYCEILEIGGTQISTKSQYKKSKEPITLTETSEDKEFSVLVNGKADEKLKQIELSEKNKMIEYNANEFVSCEEMKINQISNSGQCPKILQTKTDHIDNKSSFENKMNVETSVNKFFGIEGVRDIVIPLTPIKIGTRDSIVREVTEEKYNLEDSQTSGKCINRYLSEVKENSINSKENRCPNINHQTLNKKFKLYTERPLICNLEAIITKANETSTEQKILKAVMNTMGKKPIHNKNVCEQTSISKNNILTGSTNLFENIPKKNTILNKEIIKDIPTESLLEDILEGNQTLENILEGGSPQNILTEGQVSNKNIDGNLNIIENVSKNIDNPKKSLPSNDVIFTENANPTKDTMLNAKIHNKPIDTKKSKVEKCKEAQIGVVTEQSLDAIQQFIEASFDHSNKDSNQTLSTTVSGKRKLRKLYTPGDLSFLDILGKRPIAVNEVINKSSIVENKAVDVNTIAVDCSLYKKQEIPILDEQLKHVTKSTHKKRKLPQNETEQLQPIEDCVKITTKKTFLEEEVNKHKKYAYMNQKVTQRKIKQSRTDKHNATEEIRTHLQSSFRNILESFRQETAMSSVMDYVRKPKMSNKKKTRRKPLAHTTKSKCNNRKFSMDRVMRLEKLDLSNSSTSMDLRAPRKSVKQLPPTPLPDPPEEIPVIPIEANTKKIHVISDLLLVPGPVPKKKRRLTSVVESSRVEGEAAAHLESELVNNRDLISMSIDNNHVLVSHLAPEWRGTAIVDRDYMSIGSKDYLGKYLILFFYPLDFGRSEIHEPTDVIVLSKKMDAFRNLNCDVVACSVDHYWTHLAWISKLEGGINFPILADPTHVISNSFGVYMKDTGYTYRSCFLINPNGIIIWQETIGVQYEMNIERLLQIIKYVQSHDT